MHQTEDKRRKPSQNAFKFDLDFYTVKELIKIMHNNNTYEN